MIFSEKEKETQKIIFNILEIIEEFEKGKTCITIKRIITALKQKTDKKFIHTIVLYYLKKALDKGLIDNSLSQKRSYSDLRIKNKQWRKILQV